MDAADKLADLETRIALMERDRAVLRLAVTALLRVICENAGPHAVVAEIQAAAGEVLAIMKQQGAPKEATDELQKELGDLLLRVLPWEIPRGDA